MSGFQYEGTPSPESPSPFVFWTQTWDWDDPDVSRFRQFTPVFGFRDTVTDFEGDPWGYAAVRLALWLLLLVLALVDFARHRNALSVGGFLSFLVQIWI